MTEKEKTDIATEFFPFAVQAIYNSSHILSDVLTGRWWEYPDGETEETLKDCKFVIDALLKLGISAPVKRNENKGYLYHLYAKEVRELIPQFSWTRLQYNKKLQSLINQAVEYKRKEIRKEILDECQQLYTKRMKKYDDAMSTVSEIENAKRTLSTELGTARLLLDKALVNYPGDTNLQRLRDHFNGVHQKILWILSKRDKNKEVTD